MKNKIDLLNEKLNSELNTQPRLAGATSTGSLHSNSSNNYYQKGFITTANEYRERPVAMKKSEN